MQQFIDTGGEARIGVVQTAFCWNAEAWEQWVEDRRQGKIPAIAFFDEPPVPSPFAELSRGRDVSVRRLA